LIGKGGIYADLWAHQSGGYEHEKAACTNSRPKARCRFLMHASLIKKKYSEIDREKIVRGKGLEPLALPTSRGCSTN
jgi:hypothetical protein